MLFRSRQGYNINFRVGDKVLNCKNNYDALSYERYMWEKNMDNNESENEPEFNKIAIVNGDMGYIKEIDEDKNIIVQFDNDLVVYTHKTITDLLLGSTISTHRSQGSQAKCVINITHPQHKKILSRAILYVADTRSQERLVEIGDVETINNSLQIVETETRNTFLKELLCKEMKNET